MKVLYTKWHSNPYHQHIHWALFLALSLFLSLNIINAINLTYNETQYAYAQVGKALYVNNSGSPACSDATTYANNSQANPWCSLLRATWGNTTRTGPSTPSQAAVAGDTVYITAGTYISTVSNLNSRYDALYNPTNSGTVNGPITFQASGTVTLQGPDIYAPIIGANGKNYIHWTGPFYIDEANILTHPDTGPVVLWDNIGSGVDGATIHGAGATWADKIGRAHV